MSELIVVTYPDEYKAAEALATLQRLQKELLIDMKDAAYIVKGETGKVEFHETIPMTRIGATAGLWHGTFWGALIGLLFMQPALGAITGAALGATTGALRGKLSDYGIPNDFIKQLEKDLKNGTSALFLLVRRATPDKVLAEVKKYGGTIVHSTLSEEDEQRLQSALSAGKAAGQGA
jgi:uncharacterized membrane protein